MNRIIAIFFLLIAPLSADEPLAEKAFKEYIEAEHAITPEARKKAFNEALADYIQAEPENPSGALCLNIANTYFQLGEYGFAILYYYKAQKEMPRDEQVTTNLRIALQKAGLSFEEPSFIDTFLLFFHTRLSHNEKAWISLLLFFFAFGVISFHTWLPQEYLQKLAIFSVCIGAVLFISLAWEDYFTRPEVVMVRPTELRRDAGDQYAAISCKLCVPGAKFEVIGLAKDGNWIKIALPSGESGYIAKEYVRSI